MACGTSIFRARRRSLDITVNGKLIKAIAQASKQGFLYVFDRVTGTAGLADRGAGG